MQGGPWPYPGRPRQGLLLDRMEDGGGARPWSSSYKICFGIIAFKITYVFKVKIQMCYAFLVSCKKKNLLFLSLYVPLLVCLTF